MDVHFEDKQLKPGDPGYVYDRQVEFGEAEEPSGWDDSDEDEDDAGSGSDDDYEDDFEDA